MLRLRERENLNIVHLRVARAQASDAARLLHLAESQSMRIGEPTSLWQGPDCWLLVSDKLTSTEIVHRCEGSLSRVTFNATDNSDALIAAEVLGDDVREFLSSACGLDFRVEEFPVGDSRVTRFAQIRATVSATRVNSFEIYFDRSYRDYVEDWTASSMKIMRRSCVAK